MSRRLPTEQAFRLRSGQARAGLLIVASIVIAVRRVGLRKLRRTFRYTLRRPFDVDDREGNSYQNRKLDDGSVHEVLKNFPTESELIRRASQLGWGANVELFEFYWLLTFWAPK